MWKIILALALFVLLFRCEVTNADLVDCGVAYHYSKPYNNSKDLAYKNVQSMWTVRNNLPPERFNIHVMVRWNELKDHEDVNKVLVHAVRICNFYKKFQVM